MSYYYDHKKAEKVLKAQDREFDKQDKKVKAIKAGKFSDRRLKRIIRDSNNLNHTCELACRHMKKEKNLFKLLLTIEEPKISGCICKNISNLDRLLKFKAKNSEHLMGIIKKQVIERIEKLQIIAIEKGHYTDKDLMGFIATSSNTNLVSQAMKFYQDQKELACWMLVDEKTKDFVEYVKVIDIDAFSIALEQLNSMDVFERVYKLLSKEKQNLILDYLSERGDAFMVLLSFYPLNDNRIDAFLQKVRSKEKLYQLSQSATSHDVQKGAASKLASLLIKKEDKAMSLDVLMNCGLGREQVSKLFEKYIACISFADLANKAACKNVRLLALNELADAFLAKKTIDITATELLVKGQYLSSQQVSRLLKRVKEKEELKKVFAGSENQEVLLAVTRLLAKDLRDDIDLRNDFAKYLNSGRIPFNEETIAIVEKAGKRVVDKYGEEKCDSCNGTGYTPYLDHDPCDWCNGRGYESVVTGKKVVD